MYKNLQKDRKETVLRAQLSSTLSWKVRIGLKANKHLRASQSNFLVVLHTFQMHSLNFDDQKMQSWQ